ncbi:MULTISPECIES: SusC/RagA family TonB-linked outer membrane protein [unclassified Sphingobacterium]|uniref:SusC/RagA family TonB-linked outer membrane protein n=1 Tax=unclassified Sphingobacterium TaxID=2609468 RepID=UPI0025FBA7E9|nr:MULTISPECIES: TonB-dependent receptor [unclassified Sphingobacterium]
MKLNVHNKKTLFYQSPSFFIKLLTLGMVVPTYEANAEIILTKNKETVVKTKLKIFNTSALKADKFSGKIVDDKGLPIIGATVKVKGTSKAVSTDANGGFILDANKGDVLQISFMGYESKEITITDTAIILSITINKSSQGLGEVVVVGYSTQKKETVTGSISTIKGADVAKSPAANLSNSLAGRVSGVILNNRSGEPGYDGSSISIRGSATTGNNDVLVVVDGVPGQIGGLERLNPNDIESYSVLKDASASIYGSRAANGVILITTKRGKLGKPIISASLNQAVVTPTRLPKMTDAVTWAQMSNEVLYSNNPAGGMNQKYSEEQLQKFRDGSDPLNYPNTDWQKETINKSASQNQANLSVSGGGENVKYFVSTGYLDQNSLYKDNTTQYKQYSFRSNIDVNVTKDLKFGLYLNGREEDRKFPVNSASWIFENIYRMYPTIAPRYPNGLLNYALEGRNPVALQSDLGGTFKNPKQVFNGILKGSFDMNDWVKGLSVDGFVSIDKYWNFTKQFNLPYNLYTYNPVTNEYDIRPQGGTNNRPSLSESQENSTQIVSNIKLNYSKRFAEHSINTFVGYEQMKYEYNTFKAGRINYLSALTPELDNGGPAATDLSNGGSGNVNTRRSFIAKVSYDYNQKYLLDVQGRADASSVFPPNSRWGYFGTVSAGWRITQESWFPKNKAINELKLRASYGTLGNDAIGGYQFINQFNANNTFVANTGSGNVIQPGVNIGLLANPNITWEVAKKTDIAIEGRLFNDINFEFIYFRQQRSKILAYRGSANIPDLVGISGNIPQQNFGKVNNNGIEATLGYTKKYDDFGFNVTGNFTFAKNKVIDIGENQSIPDYQWQTGKPMGTSNYYQEIGIFRTQSDLDAIGTKYAVPQGYTARLGDLIYKDVDGNGVINGLDQVRSEYSNQPQITYGLVLGANYKGFDLAMVLAGQAKVSQYLLPLSGTDFYNFYDSWASNRWTPNNPNGSYPRAVERIEKDYNGGNFSNTFWLRDAAFLRIKSVELGYNFKLSGSSTKSLRAYMSVFNLFTLTKVKDFDPESDNTIGTNYPQQRIFNLGATISF